MTFDEKFLPDLESYLEDREFNDPISVKNLDDILNVIIANTTLDKYRAELVLHLFFTEIRSAILNGKKVILPTLGAFFEKNNRIKFAATRTLTQKINE